MTTLVGMVGNDRRIHIATDSLVTTMHSRLGQVNKLLIANPKTDEETAIAIAGSATSALAVATVLESFAEESPWDSELHVYQNLLMIHEQLRDNHGLVVKETDEDKYESSQFEGLIASRHGLFLYCSTREVVRMDRFGASGSGAEYAIGALEVLGNEKPESNLRRAIEIAAAHDKDTGGNVKYWKSPPCSM